MIAEIRREIGDPDLVSNARLMRPREPWHGRYATAHEPPRVTQQIRRSDGIGEQRERLDHRPFVLKRAFELGLELFGLAPIAEHETIEGERAQCVRVARVDRQHPFPRAHRLLVPCEIGERVTAKVEGASSKRLIANKAAPRLSSTPIFAGSIASARSKAANASPKRRSCVSAKPRLLSASTSRGSSAAARSKLAKASS